MKGSNRKETAGGGWGVMPAFEMLIDLAVARR
jgi:hypothetical protein